MDPLGEPLYSIFVGVIINLPDLFNAVMIPIKENTTKTSINNIIKFFFVIFTSFLK